MVCNIRLLCFSPQQSSYQQKVGIGDTPKDLIRQVLKEKLQRKDVPEDKVDCHILKVGGLEEFVFGNKPLTQFEVSIC